MITKTDCIILLTELENKGIDVTEQLNNTVRLNNISLETLKFINNHRELDLTNFYNHIRKSYNQKHSTLYKNIVTEELKDPNEALTTLSALLTQILLFSKKVENKNMFLRHSRCDEITKVLNNYFVTYDLTNCIKLLKLIKADMKVLESIRQR